MARLNSKNKGKTGELELAKRFRELGLYDVHRNAQQYTGGGSSNADLVGLPGIHVESKRREKFGLYELYSSVTQSKHDCDKNELPIVCFRANRREWLVIQPLNGWAELYKKARWEDGSMKNNCEE